MKSLGVLFQLLFVLVAINVHGAVPGSVDPGFVTGTGANTLVWSIAVHGNGKYIVGGAFTTFDGQPRSFLARLNPDGSLDSSFAPQIDNYVRIVRIQPDQKILIGGDFTLVNATNRNRVARLNENGSLDTTFDPGLGAQEFLLEGPCHMFDAVLQPDGKIILGGTFVKFNGVTRNCIVRLNANGSVDDTFQTGTGAEDDWVRGLLVLPNNQILVCGWFTRFNGQTCSRMIRLNENGTRDMSFAPQFGSHDPVYQMALHSDGKITIVGHFASVNGESRTNVARLNGDGTIDPDFVTGSGANNFVESVIALPNGRALIAGYFSNYDGRRANNLALLEADGSMDTNFVSGPLSSSSYVLAMVLQADRKLVFCGDFQEVQGTTRGSVARVFGPESMLALNSRFVTNTFKCDVVTETNKVYKLLGAVTPTNSFTILHTVVGNGTVKTLQHEVGTNVAMFYKLQEQ